ncbi:hypothetical protein L596_008315 [Steinernema carpocapsae]|uniref:Uncharacterized protein n=1 Tax=Steinernema carpocapsae TaxID=34508 RepID=A0A4U5PCD7_STECR|nr:hypothetical protein L596_008315 [Steinernema carpocapsae]
MSNFTSTYLGLGQVTSRDGGSVRFAVLSSQLVRPGQVESTSGGILLHAKSDFQSNETVPASACAILATIEEMFDF